ncbi:hypothetical protein EYF80_036233 [Liparis tanakae]|uniref:Uncharacterized protein n=1 Tax=Liparis tanakae TaxID=230148 RepID=A0A4Z2GL18_9TELE|nr:hypothetical protein EYF80_036233 [Liparis tanakae]
MDPITQEDTSPQTETERSSPLAPKRPRTDCTHDYSGKSSFDFPELLTSWKITDCSSSTSTLQDDASVSPRAARGNVEDEKPPERPQDAQFIHIPMTRMTTSHTEGAHAGSSDACFTAAERWFEPLAGHEWPPVAATDRLSSYLLDDNGDDGASAESRSSKDTGADISSHSDCKPPEEALEDESPSGRALHAENNEAGIPMLNSASNEGVRGQSDCTNGDALHDTGFCNRWSRSAEAEEIIQEWEEHGFWENIIFSKEKEEDNGLISFTRADCDSFYSNPQPPGNLAHGAKNEYKLLDLQICENENQDHAYEYGMSTNAILSAALCAEGSIVPYDVALARNMAMESVSLEDDGFCWAKGDEVRSETPDHTTETPIPAQIGRGLAGGDNHAGPVGVIDPAIWSVTDREAQEKCCNPESTAAGVALLSSVNARETETPLPRGADVTLSQELVAPGQNGRDAGRPWGKEPVDCLQAAITRMDRATEINEMEEIASFEEEVRTGELATHAEDSPEGKHTETSTGDSINDAFTHAGDKLKENLGSLSDHPYNAVTATTAGTAEENRRKEEDREAHGNSEPSLQLEDEEREDEPEERTEGNTGTGAHAVTLVSERGNQLSLSKFQQRAETFTVGKEDDPLAFAVDGCLPGGFDIFKKIQLPTDVDEEEGPLFTSLKSPRQQLGHSTPEAESNEHEAVPEEEEEEEEEEEGRLGRHPENIAKGFPSSDSGCNEFPNFISAAAGGAAPGRPEPRPHSEAAHESSEGFQDDLNTKAASSPAPSALGTAPGANDGPVFEKRELFDAVLKELNLFFDISTSDLSSNLSSDLSSNLSSDLSSDLSRDLSSPERRGAEASEADAVKHKEHLSSPKRGRYRDTSPDDAGEDSSPCGADPVVSCSSGAAGGEQEVPLGSPVCQDTSINSNHWTVAQSDDRLRL